jgi:hypothetical protein
LSQGWSNPIPVFQVLQGPEILTLVLRNLKWGDILTPEPADFNRFWGPKAEVVFSFFPADRPEIPGIPGIPFLSFVIFTGRFFSFFDDFPRFPTFSLF